METIILTPEKVKQYTSLAKPPKITISRQMITFNRSATNKLGLKANDNFLLEIEDGKLFYLDDVKKIGFKLALNPKNNVLCTNLGRGLITVLYLKKIVPDTKVKIFELGKFIQGKWQLKLITKKTDRSL